MTLKHHYKLVNTKNDKRILTFICTVFPVMYSPNEPVYFLGFFYFLDPNQHLSMRIREAYLYVNPCGSGTETLRPGGTVNKHFGKNL